MIFVTVGTNEAPFDRLVRAIQYLGGDELVVCQHGASTLRPSRARCVGFLPFEEIVEYVRRARVVVTHAGVGSMLVALGNGKRPIVVPRLHRFGEAVDDHQLPLARRLDGADLVRLVEEPSGLARALDTGADRAAPPLARPTGLAREVGDYLRSVLAPRASA